MGSYGSFRDVDIRGMALSLPVPNTSSCALEGKDLCADHPGSMLLIVPFNRFSAPRDHGEIPGGAPGRLFGIEVATPIG